MPAAVAIPLIGAAIGGGSSVASSIISKKANNNATQTLTNAANQVQGIQQTAGNNATTDVNQATDQANGTLGLSRDQILQLLQPYISAGSTGLQGATDLLSDNGPLAQKFQYNFQDYQNDPQYAFIRDQANQALQRSAAANGSLLTGGTVKASDKLNTNLTNTFLNDAFNRAQATYNTNKDTALARLSGYQNLLGTGLNATSTGARTIEDVANQIAGNQLFNGQYAGQTALHTADQTSAALEGGAQASAEGTLQNAKANKQLISGLTGAGLDALYSFKPTPPSPIASLPTFVPGVSSSRRTGYDALNAGVAGA